MKVFISWSGPQSRAVAEHLKWWLKRVLQATDPWISTEDIEKGSIWFNEIGTQLKETALGIICLTSENLNAQWVLFEAGALSNKLSQSRVCTFLIGITDRDLTAPLSHFNATKAVKEDVFKLLQTINGQLGDKMVDDVPLNDTFELYWPKFEEGYKKAVESSPAGPKVKKRPADEVLEELLQITRDVHRQLHLQALSAPGPYVDALSKRMTDEERGEMYLKMTNKDSTWERLENFFGKMPERSPNAEAFARAKKKTKAPEAPIG